MGFSFILAYDSYDSISSIWFDPHSLWFLWFDLISLIPLLKSFRISREREYLCNMSSKDVNAVNDVNEGEDVVDNNEENIFPYEWEPENGSTVTVRQVLQNIYWQNPIVQLYWLSHSNVLYEQTCRVRNSQLTGFDFLCWQDISELRMRWK